MGVDLHLLREAFQSAHSDMMYAYDIIAETYVADYAGGKEVLAKVRDIEERGRYA